MAEPEEDGFPWSRLGAGAGAVVGGLYGVHDEGVAGAIAGAVVGAILGGLLGDVLRALFDPLLGGMSRTARPEDAARSRWWQTGFWACGRLLWLVFLAVCLWGFYWLVNVLALIAVHDVGARITQATSRGDTRSFLVARLTENRWQVAVFQARPVRWLLRPEVDELSQGGLRLIDLLEGKRPEHFKPKGVLDRVLGEAAIAAIQSRSFLLSKLTNPLLNEIGAALATEANVRIERCLRTALLTEQRSAWFGPDKPAKPTGRS
jgi:hypothetical protein